MSAFWHAGAWSISTRAQQSWTPVVGVLAAAPALTGEKRMLAFHRGLGESGYIDGQNVAILYFRAEGQFDRLPALAAELVQRQVSVIVTPSSSAAALAAKDATTTIPIVFSVPTDHVKLGLISSLSRPGGNLTGMSNFLTDLGGKRLGVLRELVAHAAAVAVLANPLNPNTEVGLQNVRTTARDLGLNSITSSARASRIGGISRPSALAACRLMTSSKLVDCTTGRSATLAPLRIRPSPMARQLRGRKAGSGRFLRGGGATTTIRVAVGVRQPRRR
jgi:ABC-type uncharacterized transport system substrate-binding protein